MHGKAKIVSYPLAYPSVVSIHCCYRDPIRCETVSAMDYAALLVRCLDDVTALQKSKGLFTK